MNYELNAISIASKFSAGFTRW